MPRPAVSVLLPVRDGAKTLAAALDDLAAQTIEDHEVVVVDDGSRDRSLAIAVERGHQDPRVRAVANPRRGIARALSTALSLARGDLVGRMDADDRCSPERLELLCRYLAENRSVDVVSCAVTMEPPHLVQDGMRRFVAWQNGLMSHDQMADESLCGAVLCHGAMVARRRSLLDVGGYRDVAWAEDEDLFLRLLAAGKRLGKVDRVLYQWQEHALRTTRVDPRLSPRRLRAMRARFLLRGPLCHVERVALWSIGRFAQVWFAALEGLGLDVDTTELNPRTLRGPAASLPEVRAGVPLIVAYGSPSARCTVGAALDAAGLRVRRDYWFVG